VFIRWFFNYIEQMKSQYLMPGIWHAYHGPKLYFIYLDKSIKIRFNQACNEEPISEKFLWIKQSDKSIL